MTPTRQVDRQLEQVRHEADACTNCPLYRDATQTVFGEGPAGARLLLVGEQPGDQEDRAGRPFVGPAGRLLDRALAEAGIDRDDTYVTNAVKHFKFQSRGKARLHKKPDRSEVAACRPWLDRELELVSPALVVLLGATAAQGLLGSAFRVTRERGRLIERPGLPPMVATIHPSAVLRADDRDVQFDGLVADLRVAADLVRSAAR
jgi:uracil-DNA glycosylase family protein